MSTSSTPTFTAGWYPDPSGGGREQYFDGQSWTGQTRQVALRRRQVPAQPATEAVTGGTVEPALVAAHTPDPAGTVNRAAPAGSTVPAARPARPLRPSPFRIAHPGTSPAVPSTTAATSGGTGGDVTPRRARRSLTDSIGISALSSQRLLLGSATELPPFTLRTAPAHTPMGWYPDPARSGGLRFFDGSRWTARTRPNLDAPIRHLPAAALRLHAKLLAASDSAYVRRSARDRVTQLVIPRASATPSLHARPSRSRAGSSFGRTISTLVIIISLLAAGYFAWNLWGTNYYTQWKQQQLANQLNHEQVNPGYATLPPAPATTVAPTAGTTVSKPLPAPAPQIVDNTLHEPDSSPVGKIRIPRIGLNMVFVLGTDESQLALGPGLWKWGVLPGTPGNATISGHRTTYLHPFRHIDQLRPGDLIYIDIPGQPEAVYQVRGHTIASPFDVKITRQTAGVRLTMTTCNPVGSASQRLVVESELISGKYAKYALPASQWKVLN